MKKSTLHSERSARDLDAAEVEVVVNELAADQAAMRIVLQSFLLRLFALRAEAGCAALSELQDHVLRSIDAIPLARDDEVGAARWKKLVAASAVRLLGEIADTLPSPSDDRAMPH